MWVVIPMMNNDQHTIFGLTICFCVCFFTDVTNKCSLGIFTSYLLLLLVYIYIFIYENCEVYVLFVPFLNNKSTQKKILPSLFIFVMYFNIWNYRPIYRLSAMVIFEYRLSASASKSHIGRALKKMWIKHLKKQNNSWTFLYEEAWI